MAKWLTKSDYLKFLIAPAYLWLAKHDKDKLPAFDDAAQALADQGYEIERYAQMLFPDSLSVEATFLEGPEASRQILNQAQADSQSSNSEPAVFQASVLTKRNLYARSDIMVYFDGAWDIYEVKSSTKVKPDHIHDLAFQKVAWEEAGLTIGSMFVMHINSHYVRQGEIDPEKLLTTVNVTSKVSAIIPATQRNISKAAEVVASPTCPADGPLDCSNFYPWLQIYKAIHPEAVTTDSLFNLTRLNRELYGELANNNITRIADIPITPTLKPQQITQITATKLQRITSHPQKIAHMLAKLVFPIYFLDYETVFPAIQLWDGLKPYQQVPFQYSLHIMAEDGGISQKEFLARGSSDPTRGLVAQLASDIGPIGSVVVWNKSFEMGVNRELGYRYPDYKDFLASVNKRVFDLMEVFSNGYYADSGFYGSASIKKVLPVLVPSMNYDELGIHEGASASRLWFEVVTGKRTGEEAQQIYDDLLVYCGQDTLAMVKIYEFLRELVPAAVKPEQLGFV